MTSLSNEALTFLLAVLLKKWEQRTLHTPDLIAELRLNISASSTKFAFDGVLGLEPVVAIELVDWLLAQHRFQEQFNAQRTTFGRRQAAPAAPLPPRLQDHSLE